MTMAVHTTRKVQITQDVNVGAINVIPPKNAHTRWHNNQHTAIIDFSMTV